MVAERDTHFPFSNEEEIERFARNELKRWELVEWSFRWDHARRRLGSCRYKDQLITLSWHFVKLNSDKPAQIIDTILHEIAHALAWVHFREQGHGRRWKEWCLRVGATPRASAKQGEVEAEPYKYILRLKTTGEFVAGYYRKPACSRYLNRLMVRNRPETKGLLELVAIVKEP